MGTTIGTTINSRVLGLGLGGLGLRFGLGLGGLGFGTTENNKTRELIVLPNYVIHSMIVVI